MEFDELLVTTGVDALVRLVKERQRVELEEASNKLKVNEDMLEDWARILEEEGILRIEYRLTKVYLVWVRPTEDEIASESKSFSEEKSGIVQELQDTKAKLVKENEDTLKLKDSFADFYSTALTRLDKLQKSVAPVPAAKAINEDMFSKQQLKIGDLKTKLQSIQDSVTELKTELAQPQKSASPESSELLEHLQVMKSDLESLQAEMESVKKKAAKSSSSDSDLNLPSASDVRKKVESLKKEFTDQKAQNSKLREDLNNLQESSELLKGVAEALIGNETKISELKKDVNDFSDEAEALMQKAKAISARTKESADVLSRFEDATNVAKGILTRFPTQKKILQELEEMEANETKLDEKIQAAMKLLDAIGGKQITSKQYDDVSKKIDDKLRQVRIEMDSLAAALDDEKATYLAFQKINDRVVGSIDNYSKQLQEIQSEISRIESETDTQDQIIKKEASKLQDSFKAGGLQEAMQVAEEVERKKKDLEEARELMDEISGLSDNLNKRITLLTNQAKLLEIRASGSSDNSSNPTATKEARTQIDLSEAEEQEFRRKREELKNMIKKLWEDEPK